MNYLKTYASLLLFSFLILSCSKSDDDLVVADFKVKEYSFDTDANSKQMFQDGEALDVMTSETRRYQIARVLRVKAIDNFTIEVANFAPVDLTNVFIIATIEGVAKTVKLFKIKKIRAHAIQEIRYSFLDEETDFMAIDETMVDLSSYKTEGISKDKITFDFTGKSELVKKLKTLSKLKTTIKYHKFTGGNWSENLTAKQFRLFSALLINLEYAVVSTPFEEGFVKEHLTKNDGITAMTEREKRELYQKMMDIQDLNCGVVVNVSGLGGGKAFGLAEWILESHLSDPARGSEGFIHELGHILGYNHSSNMTYPKDGKGVAPLFIRVVTSLFSKKDFPINIENYYKQTDLEQ